MVEVRRRSDSLAEFLERERMLSKEMQAKAEATIADAARLAGSLRLLCSGCGHRRLVVKFTLPDIKQSLAQLIGC